MLRPERLHAELERFSQFGRTREGGVTRVALSSADGDARDAFATAAGEAGLTVRVDAVGNLYARLEGTDPGPALWIGSHLDSVVQGGRFDGPVGVLAALEVARSLAEEGKPPRRPLEVVVFTGEEGSRFPKGTLGSKVSAGLLSVEEALALRDPDGISVAEAMRACGYGDALPAPPDPRRDAYAYLELHIEQGRVLEEAGIPIGIVESIAGLDQRTYRFVGEANHAGTTAMVDRKDALLGAAALVLEAEAIARGLDGRGVATCGRLEVLPGSLNIVPGESAVSFDLRSPRPETLGALVEGLDRRAYELATARGLVVHIEPRQHVAPGRLDGALRDEIAAACTDVELPTMTLPSGAIHDALLLSRVVPAAMLFVPSRGGRSHCPEEHTEPEQVEAGLRALDTAARALLERDTHP